MNLPDGVTMRQDVEVAPKSAPMSTEGIAFLAAQKRREAEEMDAILARRQQAEQDELARIRAEGEAKARIAEQKRQEAEQERQRWAAINAQIKPSGHQYPHPVDDFDRVVIAAELVVPTLVGDDLLIQPLGITLQAFELVSPVVDSVSAMLLEQLYLAEAKRRWWDEVEKARELLGEGPWLYTAAMPSVILTDAGPEVRHTGKPSGSHKVVTACWGECYIHNPVHLKEVDQ